MPTLARTSIVTAILEAGRMSLDSQGSRVHFVYDGDGVDAEVIDYKTS